MGPNLTYGLFVYLAFYMQMYHVNLPIVDRRI